MIHLGQGDSYLFTNPNYVRGQLDETGITGIVVHVGFTGDLFTLGDSLQVDVFATPTSLTPLLTSAASNPPWTFESLIIFAWGGQIWSAPGGAVRLTMLSGSVDVSSVEPNTIYGFQDKYYSYTIPEPSVSLLIPFGIAALGGARCMSRRKKFCRIGTDAPVNPSKRNRP